jgi:hemerythrin superfamily protein
LFTKFIFLIEKKGNRKTNFIFWNFEDQKEWKNRGKTKEIFRTNIIKEKKSSRI